MVGTMTNADSLRILVDLSVSSNSKFLIISAKKVSNSRTLNRWKKRSVYFVISLRGLGDNSRESPSNASSYTTRERQQIGVNPYISPVILARPIQPSIWVKRMSILAKNILVPAKRQKLFKNISWNHSHRLYAAIESISFRPFGIGSS